MNGRERGTGAGRIFFKNSSIHLQKWRVIQVIGELKNEKMGVSQVKAVGKRSWQLCARVCTAHTCAHCRFEARLPLFGTEEQVNS